MISLARWTSKKGIERCHAAELAPEFYKMTNKWSGVASGRHIVVYAGRMRHNEAKGVLVLRTLPADSRRISGKHCAVLADSGDLEIVESCGSRLRIAMAKGGSFWFEIPLAVRKAA